LKDWAPVSPNKGGGKKSIVVMASYPIKAASKKMKVHPRNGPVLNDSANSNTHNPPAVLSRVMEKNNFEEICTLKDWAPVSPNKGGGKKSIVVMENCHTGRGELLG
jgi:hypothetical protein